MRAQLATAEALTPAVPVVAEARADLYTPLAVYLKLANAPYSYLLESVVGGERFGRYSFIGLACAERIEARGRTVRRLVRDARGTDVCLESVDADPFEYARAWLKRHRVAPVPAALSFGGGLAGYFGYESGAPRRAARARRGKARCARHAGHAAAGFGRARGGRQRARQALPRGVRRHQRSPTPCAPRTRGSSTCARGWQVRCRRKLFLSQRARQGRAALECTFTEARFLEAVRRCEGIHLRRRLHAGADLAAHLAPLRSVAARALPRAARRQSFAVHVLLRLRRPPRGRRLARDPGAARRRHGHAAPDRRHAAARRHAARKTRRAPRSCSPIRRSAPST